MNKNRLVVNDRMGLIFLFNKEKIGKTILDQDTWTKVVDILIEMFEMY